MGVGGSGGRRGWGKEVVWEGLQRDSIKGCVRGSVSPYVILLLFGQLYISFSLSHSISSWSASAAIACVQAWQW